MRPAVVRKSLLISNRKSYYIILGPGCAGMSHGSAVTTDPPVPAIPSAVIIPMKQFSRRPRDLFIHTYYIRLYTVH